MQGADEEVARSVLEEFELVDTLDIEDIVWLLDMPDTCVNKRHLFMYKTYELLRVWESLACFLFY